MEENALKHNLKARSTFYCYLHVIIMDIGILKVGVLVIDMLMKNLWWYPFWRTLVGLSMAFLDQDI